MWWLYNYFFRSQGSKKSIYGFILMLGHLNYHRTILSDSNLIHYA